MFEQVVGASPHIELSSIQGIQKGFGNEILFEANRLQYASNNTKIQLLQNLMPMGIFSVNDALEIFNMPPVEDGDRRIFSLNYVNAQLADVYQTGKNADRSTEGKDENEPPKGNTNRTDAGDPAK